MTNRIHGKVMSPQIKEIAPNRPVLRFALVEMDMHGKQTWHKCCAWGETARQMAHLTDGDMIEVTAKKVSRSFRAGNGDMRITTEHVVSEYKQLMTA